MFFTLKSKVQFWGYIGGSDIAYNVPANMGEAAAEPDIVSSYNGYVPLWYTFFSEQLRSAVLRVMPRRLTCRLPERPVEADKVVGGNAPNHT